MDPGALVATGVKKLSCGVVGQKPHSQDGNLTGHGNTGPCGEPSNTLEGIDLTNRFEKSSTWILIVFTDELIGGTKMRSRTYTITRTYRELGSAHRWLARAVLLQEFRGEVRMWRHVLLQENTRLGLVVAIGDNGTSHVHTLCTGNLICERHVLNHSNFYVFKGNNEQSLDECTHGSSNDHSRGTGLQWGGYGAVASRLGRVVILKGHELGGPIVRDQPCLVLDDVPRHKSTATTEYLRHRGRMVARDLVFAHHQSVVELLLCLDEVKRIREG